ncbi:hypothetical protein [Streptomyces palmae]|uniref:WXG100 family type VII secretion target n=1 Tax=Streptomyces palmae TaxID=1701085 RepID=A0A4Z0HEC3_9ACTN|nr:hypothetical protein [Streptomyces palmae]TGB17583.1 hypothetical protein E4099_03255 [Streptomyces palmae]
MTFEDEWGKLRSDAAQRLAGGTQLDRVPDDPPGGGSTDLSSSPARKAAAVTALTEHVRPDVSDGGKAPHETTTAAGTDFKDWATGKAITEMLTAWETSVSVLQSRLGAESESFNGTKKLFTTNDNKQWNQFTLLNPPNTTVPYGPGLSDYNLH